MDQNNYEKILRNWGVDPRPEKLSAKLQGSPERTCFRIALAGSDGESWVLEEIEQNTYSRKKCIAATMENLEISGLACIHPYRRNSLGQFVTHCGGRLYMLRPHVAGEPLNRKKWLKEPGRSAAMADFLIQLRKATDKQPRNEEEKPFALREFIQQRMVRFAKHRADLFAGLAPVSHVMATSFFPVLNTLPTVLCHGDFHPLNVVWGDQTIESVIDWEFCGLKPEAYDAALLVGCIGFDNPDGLITEFTIGFIDRLRESGIFQADTWEAFFDLVIAIRFCWLSEWMRLHDESSRDLEMLYMNLLTTQKRYILDKWGF
ncbi:phosphotransferase [Pontiella sulfatireligans]|uniref:Aminoglycoside phosphotransferase domain-containing protein n=1 Tax=Pontiella sulfatireligans TaxID=2750658 RepID=A0A6C2US17_9BACT|nr:phosphotransferase [Pontiella sulfatireligans]VGO23130.1 hypothetical protein SCARR_05234 [Pontiella sulfatireligans]